jgi:hypothetical protein
VRVHLQTARLTIRRFTTEDEDNLVSLNSDPEVMRYITGGLLVIARMHVSAGQERVCEGIGGSGGAEVTAAVTLLEVAEPVQRASIGGAAGRGLLVEPPGLGVVALVAVGLIPLEELFLSISPPVPRCRPPSRSTAHRLPSSVD